MPGPLRLRRLAVSAAVLLLLGLGVLATRVRRAGAQLNGGRQRGVLAFSGLTLFLVWVSG